MLNLKSSAKLNDFYNILATTVLNKIRYIDKLSKDNPDDFSTWPTEFAAKLNNQPDVTQLIDDAKDISQSQEKLENLTKKLKDRKSSLTRGYQRPDDRKEDVYTGILVNTLKADCNYIAPDLLTDTKDPVILQQMEEERKQARLKREKEEQEEKERREKEKRERLERERRWQNNSTTYSSNGSSSNRSNDDDLTSYFNNNNFFRTDDTPSQPTYEPPSNNDFGGFGGGDFGGGGGGGEYYKEESQVKRFGFEKPRF